jgi:DNA-binding PadR family transcriptional regulator
MPTTAADPRRYLPLTPLAFQVLLALADDDRHGYAIIREVEDRSGGVITLRTGTLYTMLRRLLQEQLIEESSRRPARTDDDERRRYYRLSALGRGVLTAEARRLESALGDARRKKILSPAAKG